MEIFKTENGDSISPIISMNDNFFLDKANSKSTTTNKNTKKLEVESTDNIPVIVKSKASDKYIHLDPIPDFKDRNEIKPWLQKIFYPQGVELVIERSDTIKVVFKCKAAKRGKTSKGDKDTEQNYIPKNDEDIKEKPTNDIKDVKNTERKKKRVVSRFNTCPFRIRATLSSRRNKWAVVIINNKHSHNVAFNPESKEYKKFKEGLREVDDIQAIKKFDELEYRFHANLPIIPSLVPCDCGLTSEVKSFEVIMPSNCVTTTVSGEGALQSTRKNLDPNSINNTMYCPNYPVNVSKPKKLKNKKLSSLNLSQETILKKSASAKFHVNLPHTHIHTNSADAFSGTNSNADTPFMERNSSFDSLISNVINNKNLETHTHSHSHPHSHPYDVTQNAYPNEFILPSTFLEGSSDVALQTGIMSNFTSDLNEIDFTGIFNKSIHHKPNNGKMTELNSPSLSFSPDTSQYSMSKIQEPISTDPALLNEQDLLNNTFLGGPMNELSSSITTSTSNMINNSEPPEHFNTDGNTLMMSELPVIENYVNTNNNFSNAVPKNSTSKSSTNRASKAQQGNTYSPFIKTEEEQLRLMNEIDKINNLTATTFQSDKHEQSSPAFIDFTNCFPVQSKMRNKLIAKKEDVSDNSFEQDVFNLQNSQGHDIPEYINFMLQNETDIFKKEDSLQGQEFNLHDNDLVMSINEGNSVKTNDKSNLPLFQTNWDNEFNS
ncbi:hypothetical protein TPHA_0E02860 [Tetrapisispora phaffii CBS 4417]|uniref:Iron-regulated transcriptional activator AFT1 n=1 Tax=Tetrapisispora phaffii (strain ATCC 24235 / CBS 4417 / NBRC 1672 / NRRL Y-8282 / UCD 70-5) TaxID=1071381 RepID=G8BTZ8_TETPH|nr:hypothetical protein TPHA_0E02860 [Tetrapisispora phaffii CBS 4417]CCE63376.1 hypothetical protein TPHA_0E02860 [Tetrapisispora phaffii CBS 4417]